MKERVFKIKTCGDCWIDFTPTSSTQRRCPACIAKRAEQDKKYRRKAWKYKNVDFDIKETPWA